MLYFWEGKKKATLKICIETGVNEWKLVTGIAIKQSFKNDAWTVSKKANIKVLMQQEVLVS